MFISSIVIYMAATGLIEQSGKPIFTANKTTKHCRDTVYSRLG